MLKIAIKGISIYNSTSLAEATVWVYEMLTNKSYVYIDEIKAINDYLSSHTVNNVVVNRTSRGGISFIHIESSKPLEISTLTFKKFLNEVGWDDDVIVKESEDIVKYKLERLKLATI